MGMDTRNNASDLHPMRCVELSDFYPLEQKSYLISIRLIFVLCRHRVGVLDSIFYFISFIRH